MSHGVLRGTSHLPFTIEPVELLGVVKLALVVETVDFL